MPVYNGERFVRQAIDSVRDQTWKDFELLVVNDGSIDGTSAILESCRDPRLRVITNPGNIGVTRSLNQGLISARGDYIARIDADDLALPERLAEQVWYLEHHPAVGLVASASETIDEDGATISIDDYKLTSEQLYYVLTFSNCIVNSSVAFRRELVLGIGGYDESMKLAPDYDLWLRLSRRAMIVKLDRILAKWRNTETNISSRFKAEQSAYADKIFLKHMRHLMGNSINVDDTLCFHDVAVPWRRFHITYDSLLLLERIHERLLEDCPEGLQSTEIEKYCNYTLGRYVALIILNARLRDTLSVLRNAKYRRLLVNFAAQKLKLQR